MRETKFQRYTKGGKAWVMAYSPVRPGGYMMVITVSAADLEKAADDLEASVLKDVDANTAIAASVGALLVIGVLIITIRFTMLLANPLAKQAQQILDAQNSAYTQDIVEYTTRENPERLYDWPAMQWNSAARRKHEPHCLEMSHITDNLEEMQVAMRFSNPRYLEAAPHHPKKVYSQGMEITTKYDSTRGQGVCWSSIGVTMQADDKYTPPMTTTTPTTHQPEAANGEVGQPAIESYSSEICLLKAIENATQLLAESRKEAAAAEHSTTTATTTQRLSTKIEMARPSEQAALPGQIERGASNDHVTIEIGVLPDNYGQQQKEQQQPQRLNVNALRATVDDVSKSLATRELSLGMHYFKEQRFQEARHVLYSAERRLTELLFGQWSERDLRDQVGVQPGHNPTLLDGLVLSGNPLCATSPAGIVAAYGKAMWYQMKSAMAEQEFHESASSDQPQHIDHPSDHYSNLRSAAIPIAAQLQRVMQVHLESTHVIDVNLAYSWAAIATSFISEDPRYAIGALMEISHCEKTTLRILVDTAVWFATYPNERLASMNQDHPIVTAGVIAKAVEDTLGRDARTSANGGAPMGDASQWRFEFETQEVAQGMLAGVLGAITGASEAGQRVPRLKLSQLSPPWVNRAGGSRSSASGGSSLKAVCFVLDVSGSMSGTRMTRTKKNLLMVFDKYLGAAGHCAYIEFNSTVSTRVAMSAKSGEHRRCMENASAGGGTNFYDAMMEAVRQLNDTSGQRKKYIIALTDGANGRSSATVDEICQSLMGSSEVTPFIIGAGGDIPQHDVSVMQRMVGQVPYIPAIGGMYVAAEKTEDLEHAFETVAAAMADAEMEAL